MSPRTTRSLVLGLIGSAVILTLFWSCQGRDDDPNQQNLADGNQPGASGATRSTSSHTYYRSRPWYWGWGSAYSTTPSRFASSSSRSSSPSNIGHSSSSS